MRVPINVRVIGYIQSCPEAGKIEFSIVERETVDGENSYMGRLDNGMKCPVTYKSGYGFTACC